LSNCKLFREGDEPISQSINPSLILSFIYSAVSQSVSQYGQSVTQQASPVNLSLPQSVIAQPITQPNNLFSMLRGYCLFISYYLFQLQNKEG
jgi:hypothetical protein